MLIPCTHEEQASEVTFLFKQLNFLGVRTTYRLKLDQCSNSGGKRGHSRSSMLIP